MPERIFYFSSLTEAVEIELCLHRVIQSKLSLRLLLKATSSSYNQHCETPFEFSLKLCN